MTDLVNILSAAPGVNWIWDGLMDWWSLPLTDWLKRSGEVILQIFGGFEFYRLIDRRVFKRRTRLEDENESLEFRVKAQNDTISGLRKDLKQLNAELLSARAELPTAAIARAERELKEFNPEKATHYLEQWFTDNAASITAIAKRLAQYHIVRAVPEPGDHLQRAREMLRLARGASPNDDEAREILSELNTVNAAFQEQILRDGCTQVAWNSMLATNLAAGADALVPLVITLRDIGAWFFERGLWRLAPLFADRAAELARQAGKSQRRLWCQQEALAAHYQSAAGRPAAALPRIEAVLAQAREFLPAREQTVLFAQYVRGEVLTRLGRYGDALAEIDACASLHANMLGERHPDGLHMRSRRADILTNLGRYDEALAEIGALAPVQADVLGEQHSLTLETRHLRACVLINLGHYGEALAELDALAAEQADALRGTLLR